VAGGSVTFFIIECNDSELIAQSGDKKRPFLERCEGIQAATSDAGTDASFTSKPFISTDSHASAFQILLIMISRENAIRINGCRHAIDGARRKSPTLNDASGSEKNSSELFLRVVTVVNEENAF
jgi:hypothetical protein